MIAGVKIACQYTKRLLNRFFLVQKHQMEPGINHSVMIKAIISTGSVPRFSRPCP